MRVCVYVCMCVCVCFLVFRFATWDSSEAASAMRVFRHIFYNILFPVPAPSFAELFDGSFIVSGCPDVLHRCTARRFPTCRKIVICKVCL